EHGFAGRQPHDIFHRVLHALDEAGTPLRVLVLRYGSFCFASLTIVEIVAGPGAFADAILMIQADVKPDRRIEGTVLIQAEPGQVVLAMMRVEFRVSVESWR